jgi:hypothetical protein
LKNRFMYVDAVLDYVFMRVLRSGPPWWCPPLRHVRRTSRDLL